MICLHILSHQTSYWDSLILATAHRVSCEKFYSEDLNTGEVFGSLEVVNPFIWR